MGVLMGALLDELSHGGAAVAERRIGVLHLEVVVVFLLLKANNAGFQRVQKRLRHGKICQLDLARHSRAN